MRFMQRVDRERPGKGGCSHVWRTRHLTLALSGSICEVCERCGVLQVNETDEPAALEALDPEAAAVEQHDGTALEPIA